MAEKSLVNDDVVRLGVFAGAVVDGTVVGGGAVVWLEDLCELPHPAANAPVNAMTPTRPALPVFIVAPSVE
jgi:hypothetical protein